MAAWMRRRREKRRGQRCSRRRMSRSKRERWMRRKRRTLPLLGQLKKEQI